MWLTEGPITFPLASKIFQPPNNTGMKPGQDDHILFIECYYTQNLFHFPRFRNRTIYYNKWKVEKLEFPRRSPTSPTSSSKSVSLTCWVKSPLSWLKRLSPLNCTLTTRSWRKSRSSRSFGWWTKSRSSRWRRSRCWCSRPKSKRKWIWRRKQSSEWPSWTTTRSSRPENSVSKPSSVSCRRRSPGPFKPSTWRNCDSRCSPASKSCRRFWGSAEWRARTSRSQARACTKCSSRSIDASSSLPNYERIRKYN